MPFWRMRAQFAVRQHLLDELERRFFNVIVFAVDEREVARLLCSMGRSRCASMSGRVLPASALIAA